MNKIIVFIIIFILVTIKTSNSQESEQPKVNDSITTYTDLPTDEQRLAWNHMSDEWLKTSFYDCLKQNNIKMSCAHCAKVYMTVDFKIDSSGKVSEYNVIKENKCGELFTEKLTHCFLEFFLNAEFPKGLRNMVFEINIGNGLKC